MMTPFQKKLLLHSGILVGLMGVLGIALFFFAQKISADATQIQDTRKQLYDWVMSLESFASIRSEYTLKAQRDIQVLQNRLPQKELLIDLKKELQFIAAGEGVTVNLIFNQDSDSSGVYVGAISISITADGSYDNITRFISRLNQMRYLVSIDSMTLDRKDTNIVEMDAKGRVFYQK